MAATLENVRFLVVDDNPHLLDIVRTILRGFGATVVFDANNAGDAFQLLKRGEIDIVILDYQLGETDGVEFLRRLRSEENSPAPFMPVIMLTAHSDRTRVQAARDAGANEFCAKPVTASELFRKIGAVINHPRPFVRGGGYFGPDRRRRDDPAYKGPDRRGASDGAIEPDAKAAAEG